MSDLTELAKRLKDLKDQKTQAEELLKSINKQIGFIATKELPGAMSLAEIDKFVVDGVGSIFITRRLEVSVKKDDREKVYEWLKSEGHGGLVEEYVWPRTLGAWAKEQYALGQPLPDDMKVTHIPTATLRRSK